jgi:hypothetical protein
MDEKINSAAKDEPQQDDAMDVTATASEQGADVTVSADVEFTGSRAVLVQTTATRVKEGARIPALQLVPQLTQSKQIERRTSKGPTKGPRTARQEALMQVPRMGKTSTPRPRDKTTLSAKVCTFRVTGA